MLSCSVLRTVYLEPGGLTLKPFLKPSGLTLKPFLKPSGLTLKGEMCNEVANPRSTSQRFSKYFKVKGRITFLWKLVISLRVKSSDNSNSSRVCLFCRNYQFCVIFLWYASWYIDKHGKDGKRWWSSENSTVPTTKASVDFKQFLKHPRHSVDVAS